MQTRVNGKCPVCKVPMSNAQWVDLPTALKMHQAIDNVKVDKKGKGNAESNRGRVTRWIRDNLEARMPLNNEEEKKQELTEEDRTWVRERGVEARQGFVERIDDERHEDDRAVPDLRE